MDLQHILLMASATFNPLLVKNAVEAAELAATDFVVAVFGVEVLGADEDDGGVEVQRGVAEFDGAFFQGVVDGLAEALSLEVGVDAYLLDFGASGVGAAEGAHRDDAVGDGAHQEFSHAVEINGFDLI